MVLLWYLLTCKTSHETTYTCMCVCVCSLGRFVLSRPVLTPSSRGRTSTSQSWWMGRRTSCGAPSWRGNVWPSHTRTQTHTGTRIHTQAHAHRHRHTHTHTRILWCTELVRSFLTHTRKHRRTHTHNNIWHTHTHTPTHKRTHIFIKQMLFYRIRLKLN